jgi:hypothetical protein
MRKGLALLVLLLPAPAVAETQVRRVGDLVEVRATATPLADVLDRLARETGMKIVYEGAPPRGRVNLALPAVPAAQAILSVLEGQGLNYLARMDASGTRVEMLFVVSGVAASSPAASAASSARAGFRPPVPEEDDEPEPEPEPVAERPERPEAPERPERPSERLERLQRERAERAQQASEDEKPQPGPGSGPFQPGAIQPLVLPPGASGPPGTVTGVPAPLRMPTRPAPTASPAAQ